jgi:dGTPase
VTQVVSADEGHVFHNRLTHSLQVAQVGRRIAEKLISETARDKRQLFDLDPDVVEAACLAHDLGHPPFGHTAEQELNKLATSSGLKDGFEGNAQSFRIVTKLSSASPRSAGLNLTRATLNAMLKYPWLRDENPNKKDKWGAYQTEKPHFEWSRALSEHSGERTFIQSAEANLMDLADDITYSVHDLDDFYRAGLIPMDRLRIDPGERQRFYADVFERRAGAIPQGMDLTYLRGAFENFIDKITLGKPYEGTLRDRGNLRDFTSYLIGEFVRSISIETSSGDTRVTMIKERRAEIFMLKELTWHYVIKAPALTTQQEGQRAIIRGLFDLFNKAATSIADKNLDIFPIGVRQRLLDIQKSEGQSAKEESTRAVIDFIVSLTEEQAVDAYGRLTGISLGSAFLHRWR